MKGHTSEAPSLAADFPVVRAIRKGVRIRRKRRPEDETAIKTQRLAQFWRSEAMRLAQAAPGSDDHRAAVCAADALGQLPRNSLRCLVSTLDEERDFALRCADLEILRAEHALLARRIDRLRILDGDEYPDSSAIKPLVDENNRAWNRIITATIEMAETPVRNRRHLELKRHLIGRIWLGAEGAWYDRMRAGIAADIAWLDERCPKTSRTRRSAAPG